MTKIFGAYNIINYNYLLTVNLLKTIINLIPSVSQGPDTVERAQNLESDLYLIVNSVTYYL